MTSTEAAVTATPTTTARGLGTSYRKLFGASVVSNLGDGVSIIAMPWLASAITRNPALVALVFVAQRLPWLVFTLPAGVITDRVDRRRAMVAMDVCRFALVLLVALAVLGRQGTLPAPNELDTVVGTQVGLFVVLLVATLLLGMAEVLRDNSAQTILPALVPPDRLEKANGQMWSAEGVANTFIGPPLASLLLAVAFALPFFVNASTFFVSAALLATIPGRFRADQPILADGAVRPTWRADLAEGVRWLWRHPLLRPMAVILGVMNMASMITFSTLVLFAQEVLGAGPLLFTVIGFGGAIGGVIGGAVASFVSRRLGSGTCLAIVLLGEALISTAVGFSSHWAPVFVLFGFTTLLGMLWNVITVSLRQTIIPSGLLGRVNSVYRFFAWGMMPIGAAIGGATVVLIEQVAPRDWALRSAWFLSGAIHLVLFVVGRARLTTPKIEAARAAGAATPPT